MTTDSELHAIGELFEEIEAALIRLAQRPNRTGPVSDALDLLTGALLSHFAHEERELAGPLAQYCFYQCQL
jgi:hypothetical protein